MSQIIDFTHLEYNSSSAQATCADIISHSQRCYQDKQAHDVENVSTSENELLLKEMFPDKILFTIAEAAGVLNISKEFIRIKIINGIIPCVAFGDTRRIHFSTMVKLLTNGVTDGYN